MLTICRETHGGDSVFLWSGYNLSLFLLLFCRSVRKRYYPFLRFFASQIKTFVFLIFGRLYLPKKKKIFLLCLFLFTIIIFQIPSYPVSIPPSLAIWPSSNYFCFKNVFNFNYIPVSKNVIVFQSVTDPILSTTPQGTCAKDLPTKDRITFFWSLEQKWHYYFWP